MNKKMQLAKRFHNKRVIIDLDRIKGRNVVRNKFFASNRGGIVYRQQHFVIGINIKTRFKA